jgi:OOP family OmpA-OmpF porin
MKFQRSLCLLIAGTCLFGSLAFSQPAAPRKVVKEALITPKVTASTDKEKELKLGEDEPGCKDSPLLARIAGCSIIQCDAKESDTLDIQIGVSGEGAPQKESMDGGSETVYYLCPTRMLPAQIVKLSEAALLKSDYKAIYYGKDGEDFPIVTGMKDTQWIQISTYMYNEYSAYIQTAIKVPAENQANSEALAEELIKNGRMVLLGINFEKSGSDLPADAEKMLGELAAFLIRQPDWRIRVEGHVDSSDENGSVPLSQKRASAVATWLLEHGIDKSRLSIQGFGDSKPAGDKTTEEGRAKNRRLELVRF